LSPWLHCRAIFAIAICNLPICHFDIWQRTSWATFWAIFFTNSSGHPGCTAEPFKSAPEAIGLWFGRKVAPVVLTV
jgi:hypothetical protein